MDKREKLLRFFELPPQVGEELPDVSLVGNGHFTLRGRQRLIFCSEEKIIFATTCGRLAVLGEGLFIASILSGETCVEGRIEKIGYLNGEL